jgi:hypothetical protein
MSWVLVFTGLVVLLVAVHISIRWWAYMVVRERRMAAQRQPRVFETWQEPPPDEHTATGENSTP